MNDEIKQPDNLKLRRRETRYGGTHHEIMQLELPNAQSQFAMELMRHLAICAGAPDGEDSSGRQKGRLMTPAEVVARAVEIADTAWLQFKEKNWILRVPALPDEEPTSPVEGSKKGDLDI
jgi:hypothetical protein